MYLSQIMYLIVKFKLCTQCNLTMKYKYLNKILFHIFKSACKYVNFIFSLTLHVFICLIIWKITVIYCIVLFEYSFNVLHYYTGNSELMNTFSSTPEYISEDPKAIQFSVSTKVSPKLENIDINTTIMKRR
jgi:hypothetical protein